MRFDDGLRAWIEAAAEQERRTLSGLVRVAVEEYLRAKYPNLEPKHPKAKK